MAEITVLQRAAIQRALDSADTLSKGISQDGKCELDGDAYNYASLEVLEIQHWLNVILSDAEPI